MFKLIRAMMNFVRGIIAGVTSRMHGNVHVIAASYDMAAERRESQFQQARNAVAEHMGIVNERRQELKELGKKIERLDSIKAGAQTAMQKRIDALRASGQSKDQIVGDAEFKRHKAAYDDASTSLAAAHQSFDKKDADLKEREKRIESVKVDLQNAQREIAELREEKQDAIASVALAQRTKEIDDLKVGLAQNSADSDLQAARAARDRITNSAKIASELAGNDTRRAESEYLNYAAANKNDAELNAALNWGEEKNEDLSPAKLPE